MPVGPSMNSMALSSFDGSSMPSAMLAPKTDSWAVLLNRLFLLIFAIVCFYLGARSVKAGTGRRFPAPIIDSEG